MSCKRIFVCSPLRAETSEGYARNLQIARELTRAVLLAGHAPYTPHLWYTSHLDDTREDQRKMGMAAGASWLRVADEIWVYAIDESECSSGMKAEILAAGKFQLSVKAVWMPECFAEVRARHLADRSFRAIQDGAQRNGTAKLTEAEIDAEIAAMRSKFLPPCGCSWLSPSLACQAEGLWHKGEKET